MTNKCCNLVRGEREGEKRERETNKQSVDIQHKWKLCDNHTDTWWKQTLQGNCGLDSLKTALKG